MACTSLPEFLTIAWLLVLTRVAIVAGVAPPLRAPRLGASRTPPPPRLVNPPPILAPRYPPGLVIPIPTPTPRPPPLLGNPPAAGAPRLSPRLGYPAPTSVPRPPPVLGAKPVPTPAPRPLLPSPTPRLPPRLGYPAPTPSPRPLLPTSAPRPPPLLRKPAPTPAPRSPPRLRKPAPAPAPLPSPRLGDPLPAPVVAPGGPKVPALIAFGDSIVDTGNNNYLPTIARANFPPYGKDFPGHRATGRFSDGKISVDFLASALGLKEFLPPYLQHNLSMEELKTGVSFASGANGYNNNTCLLASALTMEKQLQLFREYKTKVGTVPERALYIIVSGSNDIVQHFTWADGLTEPEYADIMTQRAVSIVQALIGEGARQIAVAGAPPVGCIPSQRRIAGGVRTQCATDRNQLALIFNRKLSVELSRLAGRNRGVNIFFVDMYSIVADVVQRYQALGFTNGKDACCGFIGLAGGPLCNFASKLCEDPGKYVFWDSYHPSERAYKIMIDDFMTRYMRYIH